VWIVGVLLVLGISGPIAVHRYIQYRDWRQYQFHRRIDVACGPWQVLDPGHPVEPLKFEIAREVSGAVVEPGDLIRVSLDDYSGNGKKVESVSL
jgi:hypothetical protein